MSSKICKLESSPFQLGQCSCAELSLQWSVLSLNYIILFALIFILNVVIFVVVLWLFRFEVCLDCPLLHHLYHPLLEICLLHLLACSFPLNLWTVLLQHFILLLQIQFFVILQFHVIPGSDLALVEYQLIIFHQFLHIRNFRSRYLPRWFLLILHYICHIKKFRHHNPLLQSRYNWRLHHLLYLLFLIP